MNHARSLDPAAGTAVSVTVVPSFHDAVHVAPQLIPAGTLVTVPLPVSLPEFTHSIVSGHDGVGGAMNVAVTT